MVVDSSRIAAFPDFADLPADELDVLAASMSEVEVEAGANVITLDDYGTAIYFIEEGREGPMFCRTAEKRTKPSAPGGVLGEIGLLLTAQRTATVVARTPMRLLSLSGQDFDRIRARVPEVERSLRRLGLDAPADESSSESRRSNGFPPATPGLDGHIRDDTALGVDRGVSCGTWCRRGARTPAHVSEIEPTAAQVRNPRRRESELC